MASPKTCLHTSAVTARRLAAREAMAQEEKQRLAARREEIITSVISELRDKQIAWETARRTQIAVLKGLQSQALSSLGMAQKTAVRTELEHREQAKSSAMAWKQLAQHAVHRQKVALARRAVENATTERARASDQAIYRREVTQAASRHNRRVVRRTQSSHGRNASHSASSRSRSRSRHESKSGLKSPPRQSSFYGPHGVDAVDARVAKDETVVTSALRRTPQDGVPSNTSVVRKPTLIVRESALSRSKSPNARSVAAASAKVLEEQRRSAGEVDMRRSVDAVARGAEAGARLRESREGMYLLQEMQRLDASSRASALPHGRAFVLSRSQEQLLPGSSSAPIGLPLAPGGAPLQQGVVMPSVWARDGLGIDRLAPPQVAPMSSNPDYDVSNANLVPRRFVPPPIPGAAQNAVHEARLYTSSSTNMAGGDDGLDDEDIPQPRRSRMSDWSFSETRGLQPPTNDNEEALKRAFEAAFLESH